MHALQIKLQMPQHMHTQKVLLNDMQAAGKT